MKATKLKEAVAQGLGIKWYGVVQPAGPFKKYQYIILWGKYQGIWAARDEEGYTRQDISASWYRGVSFTQNGKYLSKEIKVAGNAYPRGTEIGRAVLVKLLREVHKNIPAWALKTLRAKRPGERICYPMLKPDVVQAFGELNLQFVKENYVKLMSIADLAKAYNVLHRLKYMTEFPTKETFRKIFRTFKAQSINILWAAWNTSKISYEEYRAIAKIERGVETSIRKLTQKEKLTLRLLKNVPETERKEKYYQVEMLIGDSHANIHRRNTLTFKEKQEQIKELFKITRIRNLHEFHNRVVANYRREHQERQAMYNERISKLLEIKEYAAFPYPLPEGVTQLLTPESMDNESDTMEHCIANYKLEAAESSSYFFKYNYNGVRGSIQVQKSFVANTHWRIVQFFGKRNSLIPTEHQQRVHEWLAQCTANQHQPMQLGA